MDNFWIWLKKANARAVFFCLLAALLLVSAWWSWKLLTPIRMPPPPSTTAPTQNLPPPSLGILAYLQNQQTVSTNRSANLFTPPESFNPPQSPPKNQNAPAAATAQAKPDSPKNTTKPPPPRPKELITLTYKGMFIRGDGVHVALIADSKSNRASFYTPGKVLFGLKIMTIEAESLGASAPDLAEVKLKRGVSISFPEE